MTAGSRSAYSVRPGAGVCQDSFWYTGWLLTFLATGDQTQGRFALIDALTRKGNCPPRRIQLGETTTIRKTRRAPLPFRRKPRRVDPGQLNQRRLFT